MNILKGLTERLNFTMPRVKCAVPGFEVSITKEEGVLLTSTPKDDPEAKSRPASVAEYFAVAVRPTGENPEYPAQEEPTVFRFTRALPHVSGFGFNGGVQYIPHAAKWTDFKLREEFTEPGSYSGQMMPPHHTVMLRGNYLTAEGEESYMASGSWVRKSEKESEEWKRAAAKPRFFL